MLWASTQADVLPFMKLFSGSQIKRELSFQLALVWVTLHHQVRGRGHWWWVPGGCSVTPFTRAPSPRGDVCCFSLCVVSNSRLTLCTPPGVWTWTQSLKVAPVALRGDGLLEVGRRGCSFLCACCGPGSGPPVGLLFWHAQHQLANTRSSDVCTQLTEPLLQASRVLPCLS